MAAVSIEIRIGGDHWADLLDEDNVADAFDDARRDAVAAVIELASERSGGGSLSGTFWSVSVHSE